MKQNSVKASKSKASPTTGKTKSMEHAELSLDAPICEASPFSIPEPVLSFICICVSAMGEFFSLLLIVAGILIDLLFSSISPRKTKEISNGKGKGKETDVCRRKRNSSSSGSDKVTRKSNKMVRGSKGTTNPNQHHNYKGDHSFDTSPNNPCETANFGDHGHGTYDSFNNFGDGEQNYSHCRVNGLRTKNSYNNYASGIQAFRHANIYTSKTEDAFNNSSLGSQTYRRGTIDNRDDSNELNDRDNGSAIRHSYNNKGKNGTQNLDRFIIYRGKAMNEHQSGNEHPRKREKE
ncbi:unnamed protein product [Sphenostylis stenocarpa]|uniref:Uncharacterized protein n=1 Tax=Sphenostylis stenocarpa TaxID=92480 RepID=A0AA86RYN9_9FABA|nr:unnamed protein product [Sphenostylis stenocarpa]